MIIVILKKYIIYHILLIIYIIVCRVPTERLFYAPSVKWVWNFRNSAPKADSCLRGELLQRREAAEILDLGFSATDSYVDWPQRPVRPHPRRPEWSPTAQLRSEGDDWESNWGRTIVVCPPSSWESHWGRTPTRFTLGTTYSGVKRAALPCCIPRGRVIKMPCTETLNCNVWC